MENNRKLTHEDIKSIFSETYNSFYLKWKNNISSQDDILKMRNEARELSRKYRDCDLILHITVDLATILEQGGRDAEEK